MRVWLTIAIVGVLALIVGCISHDEPALPSSTNTVAIAEKVTGSDGHEFLRDITTASWDDDGRRAAELFAWVPGDALSTDRTTATRACAAAHAIASFLADEREKVSDTPANPALWQAFAQSKVPYLGAMVGDESGVAGFEPLDGPEPQMRHTVSLSAAMTKEADADRTLSTAVSQRADTYEAAFARAAVAEPLLADRGPIQEEHLQAARLRSLLATGDHLAHPTSNKPTSTRAQTQLAYQVVSLTACPDDPHINEEFFTDGRLLPPSEIAAEDWSIYDSQLTVYLAPWPRINEAIREFGGAYDAIARGQ
ncbi:hypothetical protein P3H80_22390 [Mycolicibacterium septicum]|uniref:TPR repeat region-containing protein n=1 Tax=Mycolicibacterium septicum TaxID=98668 RepID=UPI0023E16B3E|nr:hypothetical protein [Mycolicibacterium septicum]MDF3340199.1 hypothetical protein [Mycolicibacterium septicum]